MYFNKQPQQQDPDIAFVVTPTPLYLWQVKVFLVLLGIALGNCNRVVHVVLIG